MKAGSRSFWSVVISRLLALAVVGALVTLAGASCAQPKADVTATGGGSTGAGAGNPAPTLIDLGSDTCVPCKLMAPELASLSREYAGKLNVEVIDVKRNVTAANRYGIQVIPTQVFFDPSGKELYRHVGFYSEVDMVDKWRELGFDLGPPTVSK